MNNSHLQNPFEVLHLDPTASIEEVVAQAGRLRQRAAGEAELTAIRQAVQLLTGSSEERFVQAMLTHPRPRYHWPALERFRSAFRRPPTPTNGQTPPCPPLNLEEFASFIRLVVGESWVPGSLPGKTQDVQQPGVDNPEPSVYSSWRSLVEKFPG
jgi:hypothetical protein